MASSASSRALEPKREFNNNNGRGCCAARRRVPGHRRPSTSVAPSRGVRCRPPFCTKAPADSERVVEGVQRFALRSRSAGASVVNSDERGGELAKIAGRKRQGRVLWRLSHHPKRPGHWSKPAASSSLLAVSINNLLVSTYSNMALLLRQGTSDHGRDSNVRAVATRRTVYVRVAVLGFSSFRPASSLAEVCWHQIRSGLGNGGPSRKVRT